MANVCDNLQVVKMMIVVVVIFGVCWLPQHVFFIVTNIYPGLQHYLHIQHIYLVIYWLAMSNSMYNPIIYCWMNARYLILSVSKIKDFHEGQGFSDCQFMWYGIDTSG